MMTGDRLVFQASTSIAVINKLISPAGKRNFHASAIKLVDTYARYRRSYPDDDEKYD